MVLAIKAEVRGKNTEGERGWRSEEEEGKNEEDRSDRLKLTLECCPLASEPGTATPDIEQFFFITQNSLDSNQIFYFTSSKFLWGFSFPITKVHKFILKPGLFFISVSLWPPH